MTWDPILYEKFKKERSFPFEDLLRMIRIRKGLKVVDLGCGTGELTRRLADYLPESHVLGIDNSETMLARAKMHLRPGLSFEKRSIEDLTGTWDLIFSNAALHWVSHHSDLIPKLAGKLRREGQLAVQLPANFNHASQVLVRRLAQESPFCQALQGWSYPSPVLTTAEYEEVLKGAGLREVKVFTKIYPHLLPDAAAMADWISGSTLVPYFERLSEELREKFSAEYRCRLQEKFPERPVRFEFRRILMSGTKP